MLNQLTSLKNLMQPKKKKENFLFCIYDPVGVKLLTHCRLQSSHLNEHKLNYGFSDTINPVSGELKLKLLNISSCIASFIVLKD